MKLFEYAITYNDLGRFIVLVQPKACMAKDAEHAKMIAAKAIPQHLPGDTKELDLEYVEIHVRPFS